MAAKRVVEKLQQTIESQNHIIDDLVKENFELKQMLHTDDKSDHQTQIATQYAERFLRLSTAR